MIELYTFWYIDKCHIFISFLRDGNAGVSYELMCYDCDLGMWFSFLIHGLDPKSVLPPPPRLEAI